MKFYLVPYLSIVVLTFVNFSCLFFFWLIDCHVVTCRIFSIRNLLMRWDGYDAQQDMLIFKDGNVFLGASLRDVPRKLPKFIYFFRCYQVLTIMLNQLQLLLQCIVLYNFNRQNLTQLQICHSPLNWILVSPLVWWFCDVFRHPR